jgi:hypothetical protein
MLKWFCIIIITFIMLNNLHALKDPDPPKYPSDNLSVNDSNIKAFPVELTCAGKDKINGNIYLSIKDIFFTYQGKIILVKKEEIKSIEFLEWKEVADKKNASKFYTSKIVLTVMNNQQYVLKELQEFNKIEFSDNERKINLYTFFYDYWEKGRWRNSNTSDKTYPEKNPIPGTLLKIVFTEKGDSLDKLFRFLTK